MPPRPVWEGGRGHGRWSPHVPADLLTGSVVGTCHDGTVTALTTRPSRGRLTTETVAVLEGVTGTVRLRRAAGTREVPGYSSCPPVS